MVTTEYELLPLGRHLMIGLLVLLFIVFFAITPLWVIPVNTLLGLFTWFRIGTGFFVRGATGIFLSMLGMALLLEIVYDKLGWYRLELPSDKELVLTYRNSLQEEYRSISFNLRDTMIEDLTKPLWIVSIDPKVSVVIGRPGEKEEEPFYDRMYELIEEWMYKVRKQFKGVRLEDYEIHHILKEGEIKVFKTSDFTRVTGISKINLDFYVGESEDIYYDPANVVDIHEFTPIVDNAPVVENISETHPDIEFPDLTL